MATNKNALIRYKTIDLCLQNRRRKWTLEDLIQACSDALYEYEGKHSYVSKRTTQLDIQVMRSGKLGYYAPIIVEDKKYYIYEEDDYTITKLPIDQVDMDILQESVEMLKQFKDFSLFSELNGVIQKLEDKIYRDAQARPPIIHIDKNENLKGLHHLDTLYQAILKEIVLHIEYKSFKARMSNVFIIHPYILKEFNNRWFLVGLDHKDQKMITLALDRIEMIKFNTSYKFFHDGFDADKHYKDTYGITVLGKSSTYLIVFKADAEQAPYIETKPIHHSQKVIERHDDYSITFSIYVNFNLEIQRLFLGFGDGIVIQSPRNVRGQIKKLLKNAYKNYEVE
jgi:predicted DNA-binding transcriptional regulator YafY